MCRAKILDTAAPRDSFTFSAVIVVHEYIYPHSTTVFTVHIHDRNIRIAFSAHHLCASLGPSSRSIISERNVADGGGPKT